MEKFTEQSLRQLATVNGGPCVSMYVPARKMGANATADMTRMRNLMRAAESRMADGSFAGKGARLLDRLNDLLTERSIWSESEKGLAVFLAPGMFRTFRVPIDLKESVTVGDRFDMLPLLGLGIDDGAFLVLSLSQGDVRLFRATRQEFEPVALESRLGSFEEFAGGIEIRREPQFHAGARKMRGRRSKEDAVFHGSESAATYRKQELYEFYRAIDQWIARMPELAGLPLLLAGTDPHAAIYREVSHHPIIIEPGIARNVDRMTPGALHDLAWELAAPFFRQSRQAALDRLGSLTGTGLASDDPDEIALRAAEGRVETLFIVTPSRPNDHEEPDREEAVKMELIGSVLSTGGRIYPIGTEDIPSTKGVAAVMRY